jgi:hypothetical protein
VADVELRAQLVAVDALLVEGDGQEVQRRCEVVEGNERGWLLR